MGHLGNAISIWAIANVESVVHCSANMPDVARHWSFAFKWQEKCAWIDGRTTSRPKLERKKTEIHWTFSQVNRNYNSWEHRSRALCPCFDSTVLSRPNLQLENLWRHSFFRELIETWRTMCIDESVFCCIFWETIEQGNNSTIALCNRSFCYCSFFLHSSNIFNRKMKKKTTAYGVEREAKWTEHIDTSTHRENKTMPINRKVSSIK